MTARVFSTLFRKFVNDGVPSSGAHKPVKDDIVDTFEALLGSTSLTAANVRTHLKLDNYIDVKRDFNAVGDGVADDSAAIQSAIDVWKALVSGASLTAAPAKLVFPQGVYKCGTSLDMTDVNGSFGAIVEFQGAVIVGSDANYPVIDAQGSRYIEWNNIRILGDETTPPSLGLFLGKIDGVANGHSFFKPFIDGWFTKAAFYNFGCETCSYFHPAFWNRDDSANSYAAIMDGSNAWSMASRYATTTFPANTASSFNENVMILPDLRKHNGGPALWIDGAGRHRYIEGYAVSVDDAVIVINKSAAGNNTGGVLLDFHGETKEIAPGMESLIRFDGAASHVHWGLTVIDHSPQASVSLLQAGTGVTSISLPDVDIRINSSYCPVFDDETKYTIANGRFSVVEAAQMGTIADFAALNAVVHARDRSTPYAYGTMLHNKSSASLATVGQELPEAGGLRVTTDGSVPMSINRLTDDGGLVALYGDTTVEGSISLAGTTVTYGSFCGAHWSQLTDNDEPEILPGTVVESIDEMCAWPGEGNEQLARFKVSDTEGSRAVYGVFMRWDMDVLTGEDGKPVLDGEGQPVRDNIGDAMIASLGAWKIRVRGTVATGDLLESAGDGTARVQADDIVRSSTIAKVTATTPANTYDDGSYTVPCTLHCG